MEVVTQIELLTPYLLKWLGLARASEETEAELFSLCVRNKIYIFRTVFYQAISTIFRNKLKTEFKRKLSKQENQTLCLRQARKLIGSFIDYYVKGSSEPSLIDVVESFPGDIPDSFIAKVNIMYKKGGNANNICCLSSSFIVDSPARNNSYIVEKAYILAEISMIFVNTANNPIRP